MSMQFTCDDKPTLIAYLYGEIDAVQRKAVDDHLVGCSACASEVMALGDVRSELGLWVPPEVELDFAIVKKSALPQANVLRPAKWWNTVPVWAQAAAAVLVLAAGAAIANVQVKSGPDGLSVSTGWMAPPVAAAPAAQTSSDESFKPALVALEQRLRDEIRSTHDQATPVSTHAANEDAIVRRVSQLIADSEKRQQRELATHLIDFNRDMTMQRRADLQNISRALGQNEEQLLRQRQMINTAFRVSNTPQ